MKNLLRIMKFLATGTASLLIAACYGPMMIFKKITVLNDADEKPIPGIQVIVTERGEALPVDPELTDALGQVGYVSDYGGDASAVFTDVDGTENGEFDAHEEELKIGTDEYTVRMTPKT